jgi:signal transduction histidine kinase/ActR/RegA family two-component response regulator
MLQWAIYPWVSARIPFLFFLPALVLTAATLGRAAGLFILLAGLLNGTLMLPPTGQFNVGSTADRIVLLAYVTVGIVLLYFCGNMSLSKKRALVAEQRLNRAQEELMQQLADLQGLHELSTRLLAITELRQQLQVILEAAAGFQGTSRGLVSLLQGGALLEVEASVGFSPEALARLVHVPLGAGACGKACALKRRVVIRDTEADELFAPYRPLARAEGFRAVHSTPIVNLAGEVMGALSVHWDEPRVPTEREIRLAEICANKAAMFIERHRDLALRKEQALALKEADRRKDEFLATLAHELRNPLAPVRQAADVLRLPGATDAQKRHSLDVIERQVGNMALLLDDLLEVSRITRGMLALRKRGVELHAVIDAALEAAQPLIVERRHTVTLDLPPEKLWFDADELRLAQIITNLLTNAAKYTDEGGAIRIAASRQGEDIVIRVTDSGIGIEQEALRDIFQMFTRVKAASARPASGLGIGLALAKGLVELHGGSIEARSDGAGKGSEFTVRLPLGKFSAQPEETAPAATAGAVAARRILIADDNRDAAESLGTLLELLGHEIAVTFDGEAALTKFAEFQPDVALLDLGMPGLSGTELARAIRRRPDGRKAILIAVTGWGQERDKQLALDAGFNHHLTKPIDPRQLAQLLAAESEGVAT